MIRESNNWKNLPPNISDSLQNANVFYSRNYCDLVSRKGGKVYYLYDEKFVIATEIYSRLGISYASFPSEPFCYSGKDASYKCFLNEAILKLKSDKIAWVATSAAAFFDTYPDNSQRIPFGSHVIDLTLPEDLLLANMHSKHRNSVRKAEKTGVEVKFGGEELIEDYESVDRQTWARSEKNSYGDSFFKNIVETLKENAKIIVAYKDGVPQAGACFYVNEQMAYYMFGCSADHPEPGSSNLLHWEAIKRFKEAGVKKYSFVGCRINEDENSKYHNIQRFKERFGGPLVQGYMFRSILNTTKFNLFRKLQEVKHKKKVEDIFDQELPKWPELQKN